MMVDLVRDVFPLTLKIASLPLCCMPNFTKRHLQSSEIVIETAFQARNKSKCPKITWRGN